MLCYPDRCVRLGRKGEHPYAYAPASRTPRKELRSLYCHTSIVSVVCDCRDGSSALCNLFAFFSTLQWGLDFKHWCCKHCFTHSLVLCELCISCSHRSELRDVPTWWFYRICSCQTAGWVCVREWASPCRISPHMGIRVPVVHKNLSRSWFTGTFKGLYPCVVTCAAWGYCRRCIYCNEFSRQDIYHAKSSYPLSFRFLSKNILYIPSFGVPTLFYLPQNVFLFFPIAYLHFRLFKINILFRH